MSPLSREIDPADANVLEIAVSGDAFVSGYDGTTIRLQSGDEPVGEEAVERLNGDIRVEIGGDLEVQVPSGIDVRVREVGGDLEVSDLTNVLEVHRVGGDLWARSLGGVVRIATVGGDAALEGCRGPVDLESVGGDLSTRDLQRGLNARRVDGDVRLASAFAAGHQYTVRTTGDVRVLLVGDPEMASVNFVLRSNSMVVRVPLDDVEREPGALRGRLGEGSATVDIESDGRIVLAAEEGAGDRSTSEAHQAYDEWSERVARQAEVAARRAAAEAERQIEELARRAEEVARQATERAEQALRGWGSRTVSQPEPPAPTATPRTSARDEQRLIVLRMLSEGKITTDEAARLLEALGD